RTGRDKVELFGIQIMRGISGGATLFARGVLSVSHSTPKSRLADDCWRKWRRYILGHQRLYHAAHKLSVGQAILVPDRVRQKTLVADLSVLLVLLDRDPVTVEGAVPLGSASDFNNLANRPSLMPSMCPVTGGVQPGV